MFGGFPKLTAVFQPEIVPLKDEKMNVAGAPATENAATLLKTWPVVPDGVWTTRACGTPAALYRVELLDTWFDTQNGLLPKNDMPQGFLRLGSTLGAIPGMSEVRLVWK